MKNMKIKFLLAALAVSAFVSFPAQAQDEMETRHEVGIAYGTVPNSIWIDIYTDIIADMFGETHDNYKLFDDSKKDLCNKLMSFYTQSYSNSINKAGKDPNLYEALYIELSYRVTTTGTPEKIYDI